MDPETLRDEMPALSECRYLNTGASGPSPRPVVEAAAEFERHHQYRAPAEEGMYDPPMEALASAREAVASLLGTDAEHVALTDSTVEGINHVSTGIDWEQGDVVVRTDTEHPASVLPWQRMADLHGIETRVIDSERGRIDLDELADAVADARLLCVNSPTWNYGTRLPIEEIVEIAHDADTLVLVDAVQAPGQMALDVEEWGADFVAASGHKWLLGLWGSGFLYVSDDGMAELSPSRIGYFSVTDPSAEEYEFHPDARRFDLGTQSVSPYVGLEKAIETMQSIGLETIEGRIGRLTDRLKDGLGDRLLSPQDSNTGLVTFAADEPEELVERLSAEGIKIRTLPEPHACRVSVHVFNTEEDVDLLLDLL
ncbi:aminotransferase class V-fold PLP-dependent enzyme [Halobacteriaceae archaeon SHR40]|uniref:aminotransferase class V-fold PLP-dependent enzyme n=1 Tax=Halovenus amylolytica TaxID=2500550 RepID=UPI000FE35BEA